MKTVQSNALIKRRALLWWRKLTKSQQRNYEFMTFGYGDEFEDNSDIIWMYKKFV